MSNETTRINFGSSSINQNERPTDLQKKRLFENVEKSSVLEAEQLATIPWHSFGQIINGLTIDGRPAPYPVVNERAVRATAGLMLVTATIAVMLAFFNQMFLPLKVVTTLFFLDFTVRVFTGLTPLSPFGLLGTLLVRNQKPEWVGATQKRFAWSLGIIMAFSMMIITNLNIRTALPTSICTVCIALMWMETALGYCVGCKIYSLFTRNGWIKPTQHAPACPGGVCSTPDVD